MDSMDAQTLESLDAKKVDAAVKAIRANNIVVAIDLLNEVIARAPKTYVREYERDGKLYIKFWDQHEFIHYCTTHPLQEVYWIPCAYPRAYYYLGLVKRKQNDYPNAILMLGASQMLEPNNPNVINEMAVVFAGMKRPEQAIEFYDAVINADPRVHAVVKAVAIRGKATQLIELGQIDDAERILKESLQLEPDSKVALNELEYIWRLRAGQSTTSAQSALSAPTSGKLCASSKKSVTSGHVYNIEGRVLYLCDRCYQKITTKRKWEFWK